MSSALANLKTTYERTKSKILSKGEVDADDTDYFQEKEKIIFLEQVLQRINKRTKKSLEIFQELSKLQNEIVTDMSTMYVPEDRTHSAVSLMKEAAANLEADRQNMVERMEKHSIRPMDDYCLQFKELKRRMDDYSSRRTDMEKQRTEVAKLQEKDNAAKPKLPAAEEKYKNTLQGYDELRAELLRDLPALNNDRNAVLGYVVACSLRSRAVFYSGLAEKYSTVATLVGSIDESSILRHQHVITPHDTSSGSNTLRAHPVFNKDKTGQPPSSSPPPTRATPSQPPVAQQSPVSLQKQQPPTSSPSPAPVVITPTIAPTPSTTSDVNPFKTPVAFAPVASTPVASAPPPDPAILKVPIQVQAIYDFRANEDNELSFEKGDAIKIIAKHGDWWEGELNGNIGLLPSNYVREM